MNKKRNRKRNVSRPFSCRLSSDLAYVLTSLADATGVSPGNLLRQQAEEWLEKCKPLVENKK